MTRSQSSAQRLGLGRQALLVLAELLGSLVKYAVAIVALPISLNALPGVDLDVRKFLIEVCLNTIEVGRIVLDSFFG